MLSILIPTYNFDCSKLVKELHSQASELSIEFEILVYDDCSKKKHEKNRQLSDLSNVIYKELPNNYGRSAIRNLMAEDAKFKYLIFLDCDGEIPSKNFLSLYYKFKDEADVVCGGRIYPNRDEIKKKYLLHWIYGCKRESQCNRCDAKSFMTNNFLINKEVFETTKFDESMIGYGHEDTIFGIELKNKGYSFKIIKNPIIHIGLYDADDFLKNTRNAIKNLSNIFGKKYNIEEFFDIKLVRVFHLANKLGLSFALSLFYRLFHKAIEHNLKGKYPNLLLLDAYKLGYFAYIKKKH
ncbi:MAG: glycosyl transferase family 2 [Bacteroidetes bacterium]|nr:glycosyl transferase family 2 [Bacteroidota bacterium]